MKRVNGNGLFVMYWYYSQIAAYQAKTDYGFDLGDQLSEKAVGELQYKLLYPYSVSYKWKLCENMGILIRNFVSTYMEIMCQDLL